MFHHLLLLLSTSQAAQALAPFQAGPFATVHKTIYGMGNPGLDNRIDVYVPDPATHLVSPLIYFVTGMGGITPGTYYNDILDRIASHGFTVIVAMSGGLTEETYEGIWLTSVMEWVEFHLADKLADAGIDKSLLVLDHRTKYLMGHSSGAHIIVAYLTHHCGDVKGQILFSPVDGFDPYGLVDIFIITPGEYLNYAMPSLVLMAGLDSVSGMDNMGNLVPACAPEELSNLRFYDALPGDTWLVNATEFGHADCLDESYASGVEFTHFCSSTATMAARAKYRTHIAGEIVSFLTLIAGGENCSSEQYIQDPSLMPVATTVMYKDGILTGDSLACGKAHCVWQDGPFSR